MGRFSLTDIDDGDIHHRDECWEFIANPGEEGALVVIHDEERSSTKQNTNNNLKTSSVSSLRFRNALDSQNDEVEPYDNSQQQKPPRFTRRLWNMSIAVILVGWLFQRYLPPAPPPSFFALLITSPESSNDATIPTTWTDFLWHHSSHLIHSLVTLTVQVPWHVSQWFLLTLSTDVHLAYERYTESRTCRIRLLRRDSAATSNVLSHWIAGQNTAIRIVSDTVETWQQKSTKRPLLFLFTGFPHTGKTTMAQALMEHVLLEDSCSDPLKRILVIQGQDFASSFGAPQRDMLMNRIVQHAIFYSSGSMILLQQIEDMDPDLFVWLVRTLHALSSDASVVVDSDVDPWKEDCCPNTVFVFSSDTVGKNSIARALRQGNLHSTDAVFLADLFHSVDSHYSLDRNNRQQTFQSRSWLDAVVPFQPLTRDSLGEALSLQVAQQLRSRTDRQGVPRRNDNPKLILTENAKNAVLDPTRVEYLEWKRRDRPEDDPIYFMTVAIHGAQILDEKSSPLWKQLLSSIMNQCPLLDHSEMTETTKITMDYSIDDDEMVLQMCQEEDEGGAHACTHLCSFSFT